MRTGPNRAGPCCSPSAAGCRAARYRSAAHHRARDITAGGTEVRIGAMETHTRVATDALVRQAIPTLALPASQIADLQVRNHATIGGSLAYNDPVGDYPAACVGMGATVSTDRRRIPAEEFFTSAFSTALAESEVIVSLAFPKIPQLFRAAFVRLPDRAARRALVGVTVAETKAPGTDTDHSGGAVVDHMTSRSTIEERVRPRMPHRGRPLPRLGDLRRALRHRRSTPRWPSPRPPARPPSALGPADRRAELPRPLLRTVAIEMQSMLENRPLRISITRLRVYRVAPHSAGCINCSR
ncbi:hypothetical protein B1T49_26035 [Mycobacterium persicum]|nr:hypothetical protein B1T49_26035 [Mycobacterium persicum]